MLLSTLAKPANLRVRIVGQGLAGSLLAWACERAGLFFELVDPGNLPSASRVAAGIINPITGQRCVKSWRVDTLLPVAIEMYRQIEKELGKTFLFSHRLRRLFGSPREKQIAQEKWARGELAPFAIALDEEGLWIEPAFRLDIAGLLAALKTRWQKTGQLKTGLEIADANPDMLTIRCMGAAELNDECFRFAGLRAAKGEIIDLETDGLDSNVILNRGHWLLPLSGTKARVGATFTPDEFSTGITTSARGVLSSSAQELLGQKRFIIVAQTSGVRVTVADKHPVAGRHPGNPMLGILNGLGSKGALLAPWLALQWAAHLEREDTFDPAIAVSRFWPESSGADILVKRSL